MIFLNRWCIIILKNTSVFMLFLFLFFALAELILNSSAIRNC